MIGDGERVDGVIGRKQTTVIARNIERFWQPGINRIEQALECLPYRARMIGVGMFVGLLNRLGREQAGIFGEGDEQDAVKDRLAGANGDQRVHFGPFAPNFANQIAAESFVIGIEAVCNVLILAAAFFEQLRRAPAQ
jgi:hypothetical protein